MRHGVPELPREGLGRVANEIGASDPRLKGLKPLKATVLGHAAYDPKNIVEAA